MALNVLTPRSAPFLRLSSMSGPLAVKSFPSEPPVASSFLDERRGAVKGARSARRSEPLMASTVRQEKSSRRAAPTENSFPLVSLQSFRALGSFPLRLPYAVRMALNPLGRCKRGSGWKLVLLSVPRLWLECLPGSHFAQSPERELNDLLQLIYSLTN